jgi:hypothetical protein
VSDEQISMEHMNRMIKLIQDNLVEHYKHCPYCIPKKWVCPDANQLQVSLADWQKRRDEGLKPQEEQK